MKQRLFPDSDKEIQPIIDDHDESFYDNVL